MNTLRAIDDYVDLLLTPVDAVAPAPPAPVAVPQAAPAPAPRAAKAAPRAPEPPPDAETPQVVVASTQLARWLRLRCGAQTYALELLKIREVVRTAPLLPLRGVASAVSGVMNLRGQVVPVIDLGLHFGEAPLEETAATRIVVLEERNEVLGLLVSAVEDIVLLDPAQVEDAHASRLAPVGDERIRGIARFGGRVMLLLDATRLLGTRLH